jgi:hypothetical protein
MEKLDADMVKAGSDVESVMSLQVRPLPLPNVFDRCH